MIVFSIVGENEEAAISLVPCVGVTGGVSLFDTPSRSTVASQWGWKQVLEDVISCSSRLDSCTRPRPRRSSQAEAQLWKSMQAMLGLELGWLRRSGVHAHV